MRNNIVLCGFMGSGKTSIGRRLAARLGMEFVDIDIYIQTREQRKIIEIFRDDGEEGFRRMETEAVREITRRTGCVIACGGGTILRQENVGLLHAGGGKIIYLDVPLPALCERLKNDRRRPLLQVENRREVIAELFHKRAPLYRAAADVVFFAGYPAKYAAKLLAEKIESGRI